MTTQTEITQRNHRRAVRFFWCLLVGATTVSLVGNVAHAVLPYIPGVIIQIGAAAVPPVALLAAVHGIALAARAGASGRVYCWAVGAVAVIGVGAFALSFLALRELMQAIGYSTATAWIFPAIIDTAVAVSTLMLVALGDKPLRRPRAAIARDNKQTPAMQRLAQTPTHSAKAEVIPPATASALAQTSASAERNSAQAVHGSAQAEAPQPDADLALQLIASGVTTQPVATVIAVLTARLDGASINAAAKAAGSTTGPRSGSQRLPSATASTSS